MSKSTVSRIGAEIEPAVPGLGTRPQDRRAFVYVWLDATYLLVCVKRRVVSKVVVIATGLRGV